MAGHTGRFPATQRQPEAPPPRGTNRATRRFLSVLKYVLLTLGALLVLLPFLEMFVGALRTPAERVATPPVFWPEVPQWRTYTRAFTDLPMLRWYANSLLITAVVTLFQLLTSTMAGFALAKYQFRGRDAIFRAVLGAQMFPFFLFLIPLFFIMRFFPLAGGNDLLGQGGVGLLGTYTAVILPFSSHLLRDIPDAAVYAQHPGRAPRRRPHRRSVGISHLLERGVAAPDARLGDARGVRIFVPVERVYLDADHHPLKPRLATPHSRHLL